MQLCMRCERLLIFFENYMGFHQYSSEFPQVHPNPLGECYMQQALEKFVLLNFLAKS